jgi:hypothetical protein
MSKKRGGQRKFRNLFTGSKEEDESDILPSEEESDESKTKSWKRIRSKQFMEIFSDMYGELPPEHPDIDKFKPKAVRLTGSTIGYVEALRKMQKLGMFSDIPTEVVAQMESEVRGMYIFNHKDADMLNYPLMMHIAVRFLYWYMLGANKSTASMLRYMTKMDGNAFKLKTQRLKVDQGFILEQEALAELGYIEELEIEELEEELPTEVDEDEFDFEGLEGIL